MRDLVEVIARALVDEPEAVAVHEVVDGNATILELTVARRDLGKVIGKQGRTARSLRTIVAAAGSKRRKRVVLEILE